MGRARRRSGQVGEETGLGRAKERIRPRKERERDRPRYFGPLIFNGPDGHKKLGLIFIGGNQGAENLYIFNGFFCENLIYFDVLCR
jgi:hypothetical protein